MKRQIDLKRAGRRAGKTFKPKYSGGTRRIARTKKQRGG
jgi:hypothetical protein